MKIKIPLQIIELEEGNFHITATGKFSNGTSGTWAIDTGASKTVFDKNLEGLYSLSEETTEEIHSAGIGEKPLVTRIGTMNTFYLGRLKVENLKVALIDLSHINQLYYKATNLEICGLIGGDFLLKHKAVIDYKKKVLQLSL
ncbi:MAG: aspartyl protease family protein [Prolixibacteraceae bacterium]|nr:aspartyl protease family protein [Prolixibacteraceae bacterium]